jgi:Cytochrome P460
MKTRLLAQVSTCWLVLAAVVTDAKAPGVEAEAKEWSTAPDEGPAYMADGRLKFPEKYREWIFLSSGLDMSYVDRNGMADHSMFDNVFAEPGAYREFMRTGLWPDGTELVLEGRVAREKSSINQRGKFQTGEVMGVEVHVKDTKRFQGGWAFFAFRGPEAAKMIPMSADCYSCHQQHAAVDTTFVQFYPTLLEVATLKGTLSPGDKP